MQVTPYGIVIDFRPVQPAKDCAPILITFEDKVTDCSPVQPVKAPSSMYVTESPKIICNKTDLFKN